MSVQASFWQRVGNLFRRGAAPGPQPDGRRSGGTDSAEGRSVDVAAGDSATGNSPGLLARLGRREPTTTQMRDGYQRIMETMDDLREHFRRQDERAEQLDRHVDRMANMLEQLAATGRSQEEHVRSIADHVGRAGHHAEIVSQSLSQMPALLRTEAEAVRAMVRQMEVSQESDTQLMHSLQRLSQAVDTLQAAGTAQVETLERLHAAEREQRESLTALVREQARRFLVVIAIAGALGLGALAALVTVLAMQWGR